MSRRYLFFLVTISAACFLLYLVVRHAPILGSHQSHIVSAVKLRSGQSSDVGLPSFSLCNCSCSTVNSVTRAAKGRHATTPASGHQTVVDVNSDPVRHDVVMGTRPLGSSVVIMAVMRTGSSFVGEIFGQNENTFYLFEPGIPLENELIAHNETSVFMQQLYIDMMNSLYRCNVTYLDFYLKSLSGKNQNTILKSAPRLFDSLCPKMKRGGSGRFLCGKVSPIQFVQKCREKRSIVIKSIRIWHIGMFLPLIQSANLKVIHLVRDPRGMTASRVPAMNVVDNTSNKLQAESFTEEMREYLIRYCSLSLENKETGLYLPKYRDNYFLLRYEDMSLDPERVTQLLYNFTGLGAVPETVSKWIAENTQAYRPGVYSTTRVSSQVYQSWRKKLDFKTAKAIENVGRCAEMMEHFGYLPVRDKSHLKNLSFPLLAPIPAEHDSQKYQSYRFTG
ncbi:carbohydrate sulfotransferase 3-like [Patiria miniata]|uniref:Sulfotransferase domain-containing protein n=1 Tax=Patiria miniata TaxID=46514 RepID=A0A914BDE0_PATMI|nr:carbohydrate sulfotransferase 3-like [Patiria miniata]